MRGVQDPFFGALGCWDPTNSTIHVYGDRCEEAAEVLREPPSILRYLTVVHFCAKAVVHVGVHPITGKQYVDWDAPRNTFAQEHYPFKPTHRFYDSLVREQEWFTQIFTYLYLKDSNNAGELAAFTHLSQGHFGLYALKFTEAWRLHNLLKRDWLAETDADPLATAAAASRILGWRTRDVPPEKSDIQYLDE